VAGAKIIVAVRDRVPRWDEGKGSIQWYYVRRNGSGRVWNMYNVTWWR
jgi:hypothetical protein